LEFLQAIRAGDQIDLVASDKITFRFSLVPACWFDPHHDVFLVVCGSCKRFFFSRVSFHPIFGVQTGKHAS
jgi:hypothetical protein